MIVGSGKAALLHINGYLRSARATGIPKIYIIQGDRTNEGVAALLKERGDLISAAGEKDLRALSGDGAIADICTPSGVHRASFDRMREKGFDRFLIEKPMVCSFEDLEHIAGSGVVFEVMRNYLYSKATRRALELTAGGFRPVSMFSEFSKGRKEESINGRGFSEDCPPHVFTVEIPHQLYLSAAFLGRGSIVSAAAEDMETGGRVFRGHGSGRITVGHGEAVSEHYSCLCADRITRIVRLADGEGSVLTVRYYIEGRPRASSVELIAADGSRSVEYFENDDMMTEAICCLYKSLSSGTGAGMDSAVSDTALMIEALRKVHM